MDWAWKMESVGDLGKVSDFIISFGNTMGWEAGCMSAAVRCFGSVKA